MLKIQFKDKRKDPVWVVEKVFSIGSAPDNHLVIEDASVSAHHARLLGEQDQFFLQDTGSQTGTFVNGRRINQRQVGCGDTIRCGQVEIQVIDPFAGESPDAEPYWALVADASWLAGQEFPLTLGSGDSLLVGRGNQCDLVFPGTHLSRTHARITPRRDHITVTDLNSANGTYINDKRITAESRAVAGDRIRLDIYSFTLLGPGMEMPKSVTSRVAGSRSSMDVEQAAEKPKQWKTRPTSPGNREELSETSSSPFVIGVGALLVGVMLATTIYLLFA